jgi:hypothetical protein
MEQTEVKPTNRLKQKIIVFLFFTVFFIIGAAVYDDYGISFDETLQRNLGELTYNYAFEGNNEYLKYQDKDYGVAFELPLVIIEKVLKLEDSRDIYLMRHFVNFLLFFISTIFFYRLCRQHFKDYKWGLLATAFLILSPRIFADSFYNSKDLAFLSVYIIAIYTLTRLLDDINVRRAIVHGIVCAILTNIRIMGIMLFFLTFVFLLWDYYKVELVKTKSHKNTVVAFFITFILFLYISWPYLWNSPLQGFFNSFIHMSRVGWSFGLLFYGFNIEPQNLPWTYIPGWILVTTPILYTATFFVGVVYGFNLAVSTYWI